jgi:hypothetical protein
MSDGDALAILVQRRGSMYDPLIVDTFAEKWEKLSTELTVEPEPLPRGPARQAVEPRTPRQAATQRTDLMQPLDQLAETALQRTGADVAVIFAADRDADRLVSLVARTRSGDPQEVLSIPLGYGVSGWVAVNATALVNADARLDFRENPPYPGLVRSMCAPVWIRGQLAGVFSVYSSDPRGFHEEDKAVIQQLAAGCDADETFASFNTILRARQLSATSSSPTVH